MRYESSVTSLSWIPSEAISGMATRVPFDVGVAHYDDPPPEMVEDLELLRKQDRFRFANELRAWIEVDDGVIVTIRPRNGVATPMSALPPISKSTEKRSAAIEERAVKR